MSAEQQLVPLNQKVATIRGMLEKSKSQIKMALPSHLNADRMLRVVMTSIQKNPQLLNCTPQSLIGCVIQSAQLGLEPDSILGHAYLIPYGTTCTFIPGYKGLIQLARRSGDISTIMAEVVHANDVFEFELGLNPTLRHIPTDAEDEGQVIAFYAMARLKDGGVQFVVMRKAAVDKIRKRSKAGNNGPWVSDYEEMGKKTAIRRLCKMLPCSVELERAVALDERSEIGLPQDIDIDLGGESGPQRPASKLDAITPQQGPVEGESVDVVPEGPELCDADDWNDIDQAAKEANVPMSKVYEHIMATMNCKPAETLPKSRKGEAVKWIQSKARK